MTSSLAGSVTQSLPFTKSPVISGAMSQRINQGDGGKDGGFGPMWVTQNVNLMNRWNRDISDLSGRYRFSVLVFGFPRVHLLLFVSLYAVVGWGT